MCTQKDWFVNFFFISRSLLMQHRLARLLGLWFISPFFPQQHPNQIQVKLAQVSLGHDWSHYYINEKMKITLKNNLQSKNIIFFFLLFIYILTPFFVVSFSTFFISSLVSLHTTRVSSYFVLYFLFLVRFFLLIHSFFCVLLLNCYSWRDKVYEKNTTTPKETLTFTSHPKYTHTPS